MRTIAIINQKGGCGKTTTAINLAGVLARIGRPTLLVDLDPQSHCAAGLAVPEREIDRHIGDAMLTPPERELDESRLVWRIRRNLHLIPSSVKLAGLEAMRGGLAELPDRDQRLLHVLARFTDRFEWCLIDCPPSIGLLTFNALRAADDVIIPVETGFLAMHGADRQVATIRSMARRMGSQTPYHLLATMHDPASELADDVLGVLRARFPDRLIPHVIRLDPKLREATSFGQPVIEYDPTSHGAQDYSALASWAMDRAGAALWSDAALEAEERQAEPWDEQAVRERLASREQRPTPERPSLSDLPVNRAADLAERARRLLARMGTDAPRSVVHMAEHSERFSSRPHEDNGVQQVYGARATSQGVLFVQPGSASTRVCVAGTFNNWSPTATPLEYNNALGVLQTCVSLPPGRHQYRLVVDGRWIADPYNEERDTDTVGKPLSVVVVKRGAMQFLAGEGAD